jgi:hypothetical protein
LILPYLLCPYESKYVYRVHPINVQLVTDPVIMPTKEEHGCDSGSESLDKHEPRDILHYHVERRRYHVYRRRGERFTDQCVYDSDRLGGGSVMVCAGICHDGRTQLKIVQGTLDAVKYRDDILEHWTVKRSTRQRYT